MILWSQIKSFTSHKYVKRLLLLKVEMSGKNNLKRKKMRLKFLQQVETRVKIRAKL